MAINEWPNVVVDKVILMSKRPVDVLPDWMQWLAAIGPRRTRSMAPGRPTRRRRSDHDGPKLGTLVLIGAVCVPAGLALFSAGERYARRHGKLKRSG